MVQLSAPDSWRCTNGVEPLFRASRHGQEKYGGVIPREKTVVGAIYIVNSVGIVCHHLFISHSRREVDGTEGMLELVLMYPSLNASSVVLVLYIYADGNRWRMCVYRQAGDGITTRLSGTTRVGTGRVWIALRKDRGSNETYLPQEGCR